MSTEYVIPESLRDECIEKMMIARTSLIMTFPFFGILAATLIPVENNTWCRTLAVDGKHLFYNVEFIMGLQEESRRAEYTQQLKDKLPGITQEQINDALNGLSDNNLKAAICHEILHCAYNHFLRRGMRDPQKWNRAADFAINQIIVREKLGEIRKSWLFDAKYDGMTSEEIYTLLEDEENAGGSPGGTMSGKGGSTLDQHDIGDDMPDQTQEEFEENMEHFKDAMMNASMSGGVPHEIQLMLDQYAKPKIEWRAKLQRTLRSLIKNDLTYLSPSRRSWSSGFGSVGVYYGMPIIPGLKPDDEIDICVALDASGSISTEMLKDFLTEVIGIIREFKQFKLKLLTFNTQAYEIKDYVTGQEREILKYNVKGGGGTRFEAIWDYMKNENYKPKQLVVFTDGYPGNTWGDEKYCKTLFVVHSSPKIEAPFGETVHY